MTGRARGLMVENHVATARDRILMATEGLASRLSAFSGDGKVADRWMAHLSESITTADTAEKDASRHVAALEEAARRIQAPLAGRLAAASARLATARATVERLDAQEDLWTRRHTSAEARTASGAFAFFFRWLAGRRKKRLEAVRRLLVQARPEFAEADEVFGVLRAEAEALVAADPEAAGLIAARDDARRRHKRSLAEAATVAREVRAAIADVVPVPELLVPADLAGWAGLRDRLGQSVTLMRVRAALLAEWRAGIGDAELDLQREFIRYADVVAATCIGTATSKLLAELEFDLAIVDEAGQISTPNLLVPLVRAKRSVLVGDHMQLPPYLDEEVRQWGDDLARDGILPPAAAQRVGELLSRSAFELLYGAVPADHQVMLSVQRRMPRELGEFVSAAFYGGALRTDHAGGGGDPFFASPFAMVDTADRPAAERRERSVNRGQDGTGQGYVNALEADLIVRLVTRYARRYKDWAVIVPYRAQAERIRAGLAATLGHGQEIADNVGTVDSFQGGERDLIVYGFTRSNPRGEVGFLKELRRLNVAVSRAKRQLVLVGDTTTLTAARDPGFAVLVRQLLDHLGRVGDLRRSGDVSDRLDGMDGEPL
ncbi:AAA domain-containing protein [Sphaerisporangium sp. NPDC088356]|uniref:DEAD/DEAH box helicase n=1 Tax=Sphaerisporangium sp. NPDC088356 TaxID=3154871 RepID=UPI00342E1833